jgi:hypothetical protein
VVARLLAAGSTWPYRRIRIRIAPHLYNTPDDNDRTLELLWSSTGRLIERGPLRRSRLDCWQAPPQFTAIPRPESGRADNRRPKLNRPECDLSSGRDGAGSRDAIERDGARESLERHILDTLEAEAIIRGRLDDRFAREDLAGPRDVRDPRCQVHGLPEDIEVPLDHGTDVDPCVLARARPRRSSPP